MGGEERGERPNRPKPPRDRDRQPQRTPKPAPVGSATSKALAGLAELLKRDD